MDSRIWLRQSISRDIITVRNEFQRHLSEVERQYQGLVSQRVDGRRKVSFYLNLIQ